MVVVASEFQIVSNVINNTRGLKNKPNWVKVQQILLLGTSHSGMTSSCTKTREFGVDPYSYVWEREGGASDKR